MEEKELEKNIKSLNSSVGKKGKIITQIITFSNGNKKTFKGIKVASIAQGEFVHFELLDGRMIYINQKNVDFFEVFSEEQIEKSTKEHAVKQEKQQEAKY